MIAQLENNKYKGFNNYWLTEIMHSMKTLTISSLIDYPVGNYDKEQTISVARSSTVAQFSNTCLLI